MRLAAPSAKSVMRVLVVCGAGASSTFVAHRIRRAAAQRGVELTAQASSLTAASELMRDIDIVVAGAHLGDALSGLLAGADAANVPHVVLSDAARQEGDHMLDLILEAVEAVPSERIL